MYILYLLYFQFHLKKELNIIFIICYIVSIVIYIVLFINNNYFKILTYIFFYFLHKDLEYFFVFVKKHNVLHFLILIASPSTEIILKYLIFLLEIYVFFRKFIYTNYL